MTCLQKVVLRLQAVQAIPDRKLLLSDPYQPDIDSGYSVNTISDQIFLPSQIQDSKHCHKVKKTNVVIFKITTNCWMLVVVFLHKYPPPGRHLHTHISTCLSTSLSVFQQVSWLGLRGWVGWWEGWSRPVGPPPVLRAPSTPGGMHHDLCGGCRRRRDRRRVHWHRREPADGKKWVKTLHSGCSGKFSVFHLNKLNHFFI